MSIFETVNVSDSLMTYNLFLPLLHNVMRNHSSDPKSHRGPLRHVVLSDEAHLQQVSDVRVTARHDKNPP